MPSSRCEAQVKTWAKVNSGMLKMFRAEVLGKLPVAQHFLVGPLLPYTGPDESDGATAITGDGSDPPSTTGGHDGGHSHAHGYQQGCCNIKVPSAFGAAAAERIQANGGGAGPAAAKALPPGVRRIPFD